MEIKVYFETENGSYSEHVATFFDEELYNKMLPALEAVAKESGFDLVTESVE